MEPGGIKLDWESLLIELYIFISNLYDDHLYYHCQRFSNNSEPKFSDEEVLTMYIFGVINKNFLLKDIYNYTQNHLKNWFPDLPSYTAFVNRINRLNNVFPIIIENLSEKLLKNHNISKTMLIDSMPIMVANEKRSDKAKAANEIADKGYCSSKGTYYYGIKLHIFSSSNPENMPLPILFATSKASEHDINYFREFSYNFNDIEIFGDKAYCDKTDRICLEKQNVILYTPIKKKTSY